MACAVGVAVSWYDIFTVNNDFVELKKGLALLIPSRIEDRETKSYVMFDHGFAGWVDVGRTLPQDEITRSNSPFAHWETPIYNQLGNDSGWRIGSQTIYAAPSALRNMALEPIYLHLTGSSGRA
jgi:hypothetical protein